MTTPTPHRLMIIGGADKLGHRRILRRFITMSGGQHACRRLPTASARRRDHRREKVFYELRSAGGARSVRRTGRSRRPGDGSKRSRGCDRIFHRREPICQPVLREERPWRHGHHDVSRRAVVAGTTGRSVVSNGMVASERPANPKRRMASLAEGLGLLPRHRGRPAFLTARSIRPLAGAGRGQPICSVWASTDTAAIVTDETVMEVYGRGSRSWPKPTTP